MLIFVQCAVLKRGDVYYLIKEFKAPPRDAKQELRKYVPDAIE